MEEFESFAEEETSEEKQAEPKTKWVFDQEDLFDLAESYKMDVESLVDIVKNIEEPPQVEYPYPDHAVLMVTIFGDPKTAKTTQSFAFPGSILALGYESDNNIELPHKRMYSGTDRIVTKSFDPFIDTLNGEIKKESCNIVYEGTMALIRNLRKKGWKYDWILCDGLENFVSIAEMRMRVVESLGAYDGFKNLKIWRRRTDYLDQFVREAKKVVNRGIIFASQNVFQTALYGPEKGEKKQPAWKSKIKQDTTTLLYTQKEILDLDDEGKEFRYYTYVDSCKWSTFSGRIETTLHNGKSPKDVVEQLLGTEPEHTVE